MDSGSPPIDVARERARRIARALVRDEASADDVAQEAALRMVQGRLRPRKSFGAALAGLVRHVAFNERRAERRRAQRERAEPRASHAPSPARLLAQAEAQERLWAHVRALSEPNRTVVLLRYVEGLAPRQIARQLDLPLETVKSRLKRGLATLRERMDASHGDRRETWLALVLPLAASSWRDLGGLAAVGDTVMKSTAMRRAAVAVTAVLTLGAVSWGVVQWQSDSGDPTQGAAIQGEGEAASGTAPGLVAAAEDATNARNVPDTDAATAVVPPPTPAPTKVDPFAEPSIVRESAFGLPRRARGGRKVKNANGDWVEIEGYAGGGMTGHWTPFSVGLLREGTAKLQVTVVDSDSAPVRGAKVFLGPTKLTGVQPISYGDLKEMGLTSEQGVLALEGLPDGSAAIGADFQNQLAGRGGYDGRHMVATVLRAGAPANVEVRLPYSVTKTGTVRGQLLDAEGKPFAGGQAFIRNNHQWVKSDGTFELRGVPEGEQQLKVRVWAHKEIDESVTVRAGGTITKTFKLEPLEGGDIALRGTVVGPEGNPVPRAWVYLSIEKDAGTLRSVRADADGRFEMRDLPERVKTEAFRLQSAGFPRFGSGIIRFENGLDRSDVTITIKPRYIELTLDLLDLETGKPVRYAHVKGRVEGEKREAGFYRNKEGRFSSTVKAGARVEFSVHALDHKDHTFVLDVPGGKDEHAHEVRLQRTNKDSVEVALTFRITDAESEAAVSRVKISLLEHVQGRRISGFDGSRQDGVVRMPGWSGTRAVVFEAEGYETLRMPLTIPDTEPEQEREIRLRRK